jgi:two-component system, NtrC family, response regulator HydG
MMALRVLLVEDNPSVARSIADTLADEGVGVEVAHSAEQALARLDAVKPDAVLSDVRMPGMDGIQLLKVIRERAAEIDVVLMTAYEDLPTVAAAMREGAFEFLVKPLRLVDVRNVLARLADDRRAREQARDRARDDAEPYRLHSLVGRNPRMIDVYKRVGQLAANRVHCLLRGETGTGKGMVARAIHFNSPPPFAAEPFIAVNCTAIPETLLESELFGHVKGAFTGATHDRRGRFALAGKGTIFLDEVGDTSPEFQAKLLRVLEDREFHPVGAEKVERTNARVIAATHRDLEARVRGGTFREDLYYRLRVIEITLPPLRERVEDIPLLARHFVKKAAAELHRPEASLADDAINALVRHPWPGNVRELENCLTRAVVLSTAGVVRAEHLGLVIPDGDAPGDFPTLDEQEEMHVLRALAVAGGNRTRAAELLGVSTPRLYRILERLGVQAS